MRTRRDRQQARGDEETSAGSVVRLTDPRLDFPGPVPLRKSYIVASTDRSGSTFLCSMLWRTGVLGAPAEYWNFRKRLGGKPIGTRMMERLKGSSPADYLKKLLACRTSKNGVFGIKAHSFDFKEQLRKFPKMLQMLSPVNYIYIQRLDKVAQAVSLAKATQTGAWVARTESRTENLNYDGDLIAKCLGFLERQDRDWTEWFASSGVEPFVVTYEDLIDNNDGVIREFVEFLGVQNDERESVYLLEMEKQGDETNQEWVERFRRENGGVGETRQSDVLAAGTIHAPSADGRNSSHVFDRFEDIKDAATRPVGAKRSRHRYDAIIGQNRELFRNARVLEIYSAEGQWSGAALDAGATHVVGLETEEAPVAAAKNAFGKLGVDSAVFEFISGDIITELRRFPPESFDLVLCQDFPRLADPHLFFQALHRLRPRHAILDTGIVGGKVPMASFRLMDPQTGQPNASNPSVAALRVVPNHELIRILCDYFSFGWRIVDWHALGISDWTGVHDYQNDRRRTYVLDRAA
jgi:trehalose 2-sulfotransferase